MSLPTGTRLGPYEIVSPIGAGGMGEVYRARDTKLNRDVAIKVLPDVFATDADRLARFTREAQTLAALNHPNIAAIYGIEDNAIVMELVEGRDLSQIIAAESEDPALHGAPSARVAAGHNGAPGLQTRGIAIADALAIATQISEALEAAHDAGIIHRDLKPANIKVRADGTVKVLDFGLAKAIDSAGSASGAGAMNSPTMTARATQMGMIIGTAAYMAPEQAKGKTVDKRADIWAFGIVLYEMLTGHAAFAGDTITDIIAAVVTRDPDWTALPATTPASIRRLLARAVEKDPKKRLRDIGEARLEIDRVLSGAPDAPESTMPGTAVAAAAPARGAWSTTARAALAAIVITSIAGAWWLGHRSVTAEPAWSHFSQLTDASGVETSPTISPDGTSIAFSSAARGSWDIYVQRVGGRNPVLVAGDPAKDEVWPAFSPDGKLIAFNQGGGKGGIFIVGATGESARRLTDFGANPAWSPDGQHIVFCAEEVASAYSRAATSALWTVDVGGGAPTKIDDGDAVQPAWSPAGKRIAFWQVANGQRDLATIPTAGGPHVLATSDAATDWAPVWSPDGRFLYFASDRGGSMGIWRIGIDETTGRASSAPEPIAVGVDVSMDLPHVSADGAVLVFRSMIASVNPAAIAFDPVTERAGAVTLLQHRTGILSPSDVSPDGKWLALGNLRERQEDVFLMRADGTELSRVTDDDARDRVPRFSPDGTQLIFYSNKGGLYQGWSIRRDGGDRTKLTDFSRGEAIYTAIAPDGKRVFVMLQSGDWVIGSLPGPLTDKTRTVTKAPPVGTGVMFPTFWSHDSRWLTGAIVAPSGAYAGNALYEVASGKTLHLSDDGASTEMAWMPDHNRVLYFTTSGKLMMQDITSLKRHEIDVKLPLPPDTDFDIVGSPDGRTIYYGAQQTEANIWKVEQPKVKK